MNCNECKFKTCDVSGRDFCFFELPDFGNNGIKCGEFQQKPLLRTLDQLLTRQNQFRKKPQPEPSPEAKAYLARLKQQVKEEADYSLKGLLKAACRSNTNKAWIFKPYPISLADGRQFFKIIYESEVLKLKSGVEYLKHTTETIDALLVYFMGQNPDLSPTKGIYLFGDVGRGKTLLMRCFERFCQIIESKLEAAGQQFTPRAFKMESCKSIVLKVAEDKDLASLKRFYNDSWCFDDIGAEENYKLFGNDVNVMSDVIIERYQRLQNRVLITHATSNLPFTEKRLTDRYDMRFESRANELFHPVFLDAIDFRKL